MASAFYHSNGIVIQTGSDWRDGTLITTADLLSLSGGGASWGGILGTLSNQTDLQNALNLKYNASNPSGFITSASLVWGSITGTLSSQVDLQNALNAKQNSLGYTAENVANKGAVSGYASLDITGKVPIAQIPAAILTNTFVVASQAAMLALAANTGDVAIRTDTTQTFILQGADPTVLGDWVVMLFPVTAWGTITGTLSTQTDLQAALDLKYNASNPSGYITSSALTPYVLKAGDTMTGQLNFNATGLGIGDVNSNELLKFTGVTSAVNELTITNSIAGASPILSATGGDTNIGITLTPKGTGRVILSSGGLTLPAYTSWTTPTINFGTSNIGIAGDSTGVYIGAGGATRFGITASYSFIGNNIVGSNGNPMLFIDNPGSSAASLYMSNASTGGSPRMGVYASSGDTNVSLNVITKGTGGVGINLTTATARLHLPAGSATASTAPLKLTSGPVNTTAEVGAMEYNGTNLFFTRAGAVREGVITQSAVTTEVVVSNTTVTVNIGGVTYKLLAIS